ncbi:MAG: outer membrane beta-barrel protein [Alphaproteobacteria bacterium]|nr:outer membrane beta-barrel protein [Alphaproteobacteria bacterium]
MKFMQFRAPLTFLYVLFALLTLGFVATASPSQSARAEDFYGRIDAGLAHPYAASLNKGGGAISSTQNTWGDQLFSPGTGSLTAENGISLGVGVGYNIFDDFALELNLQYRGIDLNSTQTTTSLAGGFFNFTLSSQVIKAASSISNLVILPKLRLTAQLMDDFDIALTGGVGFGLNVTSDITTTIQGQGSNITAKGTSNSSLIWSIGTGADYSLNDKITVGVGIDYLRLGNAKWTGYTTADPTVTLKSLDATVHAALKF